MTNTSEYRTWFTIKDRCNNQNDKDYPRYGGRGIKVCDEWSSSFEQFYKDMGNKPSPLHSIDRIDNEGNYCAANCRWATQKEQQNNRRNNTLIEFNGETKHLWEWAEITGFNRHTIMRRLKQYGWSIERALTEPPSPSRWR